MLRAAPKPSVISLRKALACAEMYRYFVPGWPALAESFERDAKRIAEALKAQRTKK
jgi:hypothetical protein